MTWQGKNWECPTPLYPCHCWQHWVQISISILPFMGKEVGTCIISILPSFQVVLMFTKDASHRGRWVQDKAPQCLHYKGLFSAAMLSTVQTSTSLCCSLQGRVQPPDVPTSPWAGAKSGGEETNQQAG